MDIFWPLYYKLDESGRKELMKQLMVKPKSPSDTTIKVTLGQSLTSTTGLRPLDPIKRPHEPNP